MNTEERLSDTIYNTVFNHPDFRSLDKELRSKLGLIKFFNLLTMVVIDAGSYNTAVAFKLAVSSRTGSRL